MFSRGSVRHINQIVEGGAGLFNGATTPLPPNVVVVCAGLGARFLGDIEDKDRCPLGSARSNFDHLMVRAPWITFGMTHRMSKGLDI